MATTVVLATQFAGSDNRSDVRARIYRHVVTERGRDDDVDVRSLIAATAERIHERRLLQTLDSSFALAAWDGARGAIRAARPSLLLPTLIGVVVRADNLAGGIVSRRTV